MRSHCLVKVSDSSVLDVVRFEGFEVIDVLLTFSTMRIAFLSFCPANFDDGSTVHRSFESNRLLYLKTSYAFQSVVILTAVTSSLLLENPSHSK